MDAVGEWATASIAIGRGADLAIIKEMRWPDSLGLLYSAFTYFLGFEVNSGEYKVMGLAPYGEPKYVDLIYENLVDLKEDGSFRLNQEYFAYLDSLTMTNDRFARLFGQPVRKGESELTQREMDIARSIQFVCEDIMLRMASTAHAETGVDSLCLAGGVALNCVGNGRILREGRFKNLWIQPAAGDAGGALGVAQLIWHREFSGGSRLNPGRESMKGSYLGPAFGDQELETYFTRVGARFHRFDREELLRRTAQLLADQILDPLVLRHPGGPGDDRAAVRDAEAVPESGAVDGLRDHDRVPDDVHAAGLHHVHFHLPPGHVLAHGEHPVGEGRAEAADGPLDRALDPCRASAGAGGVVVGDDGPDPGRLQEGVARVPGGAVGEVEGTDVTGADLRTSAARPGIEA